MIALPQRDGIFEQGFERLPEGADRSGFVFEHLVEIGGGTEGFSCAPYHEKLSD